MRRLSLLPFLLSACGGSPDEGPPVDALRDALVGAWSPVEVGLLDFGDDAELVSIALRDDGSGAFTWAFADGALACLDLRWDTTGSSVLLSFETDELALFLLDGLYGASVAGDVATLTAALGFDLVLERVDAEPPEWTCGRLDVLEERPGLGEAMSSADLGIDDGVAWYVDDDGGLVRPVNLTDTPAMLMPVDLGVSGWRRVQVVEGGHFWVLEGFDSPRLQCRDVTDTSCGTIDTQALGLTITVEAAAHDGAHLWLHGPDPTGARVLLEVDPAGPTLVSSHPLDHEVGGLTSDGAHLWLLTTEQVGPLLRFDPETDRVTGTWKVPEYPRVFQDWNGVAWWDDSLWILLEDDFGGDRPGMIARLSTPD